MSDGFDEARMGEALRHYWHPVSWSADLAGSPLGTTLLGERLVLWRDAHGGAVAALDRCPHRGTALSLGTVDKRGCIACPYHGWTFDPAGECIHIPQVGANAKVPSRAHLVTLSCEERYGIVWACLEDALEDIPDFPEWGDPAYRHVPCASYTWRTSAARMVENFTDFGHLGYLHDGLLGSKDDLVVEAHRVARVGTTLRYELTMSVPNTNRRFSVTDLAGKMGRQTNSYVLSLPFTIHLRCRYHDTGSYRTLFFAAQPNDETHSTGYCYQSRNFELEAPDAPFAAFQELLAEQDRVVVESQLPIPLPLEASAELHLPFDRVAVAYRRGLAALVDDSLRTPETELLLTDARHGRGAKGTRTHAH